VVRRLLPLLALLGGCALPSVPVTAPEPTAPVASGSVAQLLAGLAVKGRAPRTGYDRALFGSAWADVDRNGCDTRNDVLTRDLVRRSYRPRTHGCVVLSGDLAPDPYTGRAVHFVRGGVDEVEIDHVVALRDAWVTGAFAWSLATRRAFANDPLELLAVSAEVNRRKGEGDAATWLPPYKGYRCAYVARQVAVKARYRLWVTPAERDAIARVLASCPGQAPPREG
jgi:hypothetical protein